MEPSEEIRRVVHRWMIAISEADSVSALGRLSEQPGALTIGTDIAEWWRGKETRVIWGRQIEELGGFPVVWDEIEAWEEGTVGWASVKFTITWAEQTYDARATYVFHLEHGEWKAVQIHWSLPMANEEIGMALTRTLDELERTIQRDKPDLSRTLAADGTVTIVFTDIVDSTVLLSRLGDHAWLDILRRHNAVIEDATVTRGGTVVETQGDGSMLAFSSVRRAVACAQAIQSGMDSAFADASPPIRVRIGVHTGDAGCTRRTTSSARPCTTRRASPARRSEARCSCPTSCASSCQARTSSSSKAATWSSRGSRVRTGSSQSLSTERDSATFAVVRSRRGIVCMQSLAPQPASERCLG